MQSKCLFQQYSFSLLFIILFHNPHILKRPQITKYRASHPAQQMAVLGSIEFDLYIFRREFSDFAQKAIREIGQLSGTTRQHNFLEKCFAKVNISFINRIDQQWGKALAFQPDSIGIEKDFRGSGFFKTQFNDISVR